MVCPSPDFVSNYEDAIYQLIGDAIEFILGEGTQVIRAFEDGSSLPGQYVTMFLDPSSSRYLTHPEKETCYDEQEDQLYETLKVLREIDLHINVYRDSTDPARSAVDAAEQIKLGLYNWMATETLVKNHIGISSVGSIQNLREEVNGDWESRAFLPINIQAKTGYRNPVDHIETTEMTDCETQIVTESDEWKIYKEEC